MATPPSSAGETQRRAGPGLTPQQARAVHTRATSVVLSSGAGCGKTHVLTERYLSHLREDGVEVGSIVAITFTERAARQMRGRIRQALLRHLRSAPTEEDAARWERHLRSLETAPIATIHAFCGTLLRQQAIEAGLDPHFEVLEEVLSINLETEALSSCLQKLLTAQSPAGEDLRQLVLLHGWRAVNEAIPELLAGWDARRWRDWLERSEAEIAASWQEVAENQLRRAYLHYVLLARPRLARLLPLLQRHPPQPGPLSANCALLLEELPLLPEASDLPAAVERLHEAAKVGRQGSKAWPEPAVYEQIKKAFEDFRSDLRALKLERFSVDPTTLPEAIATGKRFLRVAREAVESYATLKRLHGVLDFQDLLIQARDLLRDHDAVRTRLQERYRYLLIDELQDTDPVQMELIQHLAGGGLTAGRLFAVGDKSQSIYRFRGADVHLFQGLRRDMPHEGRQELTVNFRSQPAILDFTNVLLGHRLTDYEPLVAHHPQVNPDPCVEFLWTRCEADDNAAQKRQREAGTLARRIAAMVERESLVVERTPTGERLRPVRRGDVVFLFRAMSNVHLYEAALREAGLDYYLVGGRAFFAQQEIYDLLNLLRTLENPEDEVSLAGTLRSPFCGLSDEALLVLARSPRPHPHPTPDNRDAWVLERVSLWQGLHDDRVNERLDEVQRQRVLRARRNLDRWRGLKDRLPLACLLGEVFAESGYDAATQFEFLGDRKLANLWKLLDMARTFDRSGLFGLPEFIRRLGDLVATQPREEQAATQPENADVVRLMSIHQAKGLEFPVVVLPDLDTTSRGGTSPVAHWDGTLGCVVRPPTEEETLPFPDYAWNLWRMREEIEDWHESLRILYVGCTRAQDYLLLSAGLPASLQPSSTWMITLAERFDLRSGNCLVPGLANPPRVHLGIPPNELITPPRSSAVISPRSSGAVLDATADATAPIPVRIDQRRVFTVAELEAMVQGTFSPERSTWHFDAEDGSDRPDWFDARERYAPPAESTSPLWGLVQRVWGGWNLREENGWRTLLQHAASAGAFQPEHRRAAEEALQRLARSTLREHWATMAVVHRALPFVLEWPTERAPRGVEPSPFIAGFIEGLAQDHQGKWHLFGFTEGPVEAGEESRGLLHLVRRHRPGVVFWIHAVKELLGATVQSLTLWSLATGSARVIENVERLQSPREVQPFLEAFNAFAEQSRPPRLP